MMWDHKFYGEPAWENRHLSWTSLRDLGNRPVIPWIVVGNYEKEGGNPQPIQMMQEFRDCLTECTLMGSMGENFMWRRGVIHELT
jgi:hypothetical protein